MPFSIPSHFSDHAQQLLTYSYAIKQSNSFLEDQWWDTNVTTLLNQILNNRSDKAIETTLEYLASTDAEAYEALFDKVEKATESIAIEHNNQLYDALLVTAPVMVWSRYQLPTGNISSKQHAQILTAFKETIAAAGSLITIVPHLLNFETLPESFHDTYALTKRLAESALSKESSPHYKEIAPEFENVLAETYFVVGVIVVPKGKPMFRWQSTTINSVQQRQQLEQTWAKKFINITQPLLTGCNTQVISPKPYYASHRAADHKIRPFVLRAAINWLQMVANQPASSLHATIIGCGDPSLEEYRIGFTSKSTKSVIYGCVWPVLTKDEVVSEFINYDAPSLIDDIVAILKEEGIDEVRRLPNIVLGETCDSCEAPYFPDQLGDLQHPKLPEETDFSPVSLH